MKVTKLRLQNIRSYSDETVELPDGTVLVRGENGAGKTTLLMSIFGGLFLSKIRTVGSNNFTLEEMVRRGTEEGTIELTFEIKEVPYTVTWTIRTDGQNSAELDSPAIDEPISGIRDVRSEVIDVVGMDEDSFSRSVYVQQGEVDRLFDDEARAELIDDLLGLDQIDRYYSRMEGARRAANRLKKENKQAASNHQETIENEFEYNVEGYNSELSDKEDAIAETDSELGEVEEFLEELQDGKRDLESTIEDYDELVADLDEAESEQADLVEERSEKQREIEELEAAIQTAEDKIGGQREEITSKTNTLESLDTPATTGSIEIDLTSESAAETALEMARKSVEAAKVERQKRENAVEQAVDEHDRLSDDHAELRDERADLDETLSTLSERISDVQSEVERIDKELSNAVTDRNAVTREYLPEERCPTSVSDETRDVVEAYYEDISSRKNELSEDLAAKEASLDAKQNDVEAAREDVDAAKADIDRLEATIDETESDLSSAHEQLEAAQEKFDGKLVALEDELASFDIEVSADTIETAIDEQIPDVKAEIQATIDEANERVTELATQKTGLKEDRTELESLDGLATCPKCGQEVDADHLDSELSDIEAAITELETQLEAAKQTRDDHLAHRDQLDELREEAINLREFRNDSVLAAEEQVETLETELDELRDELDEEQETLAEAESELDEAKSTVAELEAEITDLEAEVSELEERIEDGDAVMYAFDGVDELREQHEERVDNLEELQNEYEETEAEREDLDAEIETLSDQIDAQQETVADTQAALEIAEDAIETAKEQRSCVSDAVDAYDAIDEFQGDIESHEKDIGHARDSIETINKQLSDVEDEIQEIEEELGEVEIEEARAKLESVEERIDQREATVEDLEAELQSHRSDRDVLANELEQLQRFQDRLALAEEKREWAQDRSDELDQMMRVYQGAKSDLREQYLAYVNEYTNDIFSDIYKNSSYQQVRILDEGPDGTPYAIQLLRDDGTVEHPSNASGGERAIVNLALRAGIYKLIAEMRQGDSGRLPPFILDEPTTFLDEGHVGRLKQMLDSITDWDVPQVIVVSHDERLIQGAERECIVTIDEETNASTVDVRTGSPATGDD